MLMRTRYTTGLSEFWPVSVAFDHAKIEELVYIHHPRDTCPPGYCWKLRTYLLIFNRAISRSLSGLMKDTLLEDGAVPVTFKHKDEYVEAEDSLSDMDSKNFQNLAGKMLYHSSDDSTIQFEMTMEMSGMYKPSQRSEQWQL